MAKKVLDTLMNALHIEQEPTESFVVGGKSFDVVKKLAAGAFADVFLVNQGTAQFVAKKQLMNEHTRTLVTEEIKLMKSFDHRNLVKYFGSARVPATNYVVIIMEACHGGALFDLLAKRKTQGPLTEAGVLKICSDVVAGVKYMHDLSLAHWDIKLENILLGKDNVFKLCDFGSVVKCPQPCAEPEQWALLEDKIQQFTSESYRAPEMCDSFGVSELTVKTDVWALGSIFYALCFFTLPFMNQGRLGILNGKYTIPQGHKFAPGIMKLIDRCFQLRPKYRADVNELAERVLAMQEGREPNVAEVAAAKGASPASSAASDSMAERRARSKAAAQARLDKKKGRKAHRAQQHHQQQILRQQQQQQRQQQQQQAAARAAAVAGGDFTFDVDWGEAASPAPAPAPAPASATTTNNSAPSTSQEQGDKWDVEFEDDEWADVHTSPTEAPAKATATATAPTTAAAAAAASTTTTTTATTQSDDWVAWDDQPNATASATPTQPQQQQQPQPQQQGGSDWDAFGSEAVPASNDGADDLTRDLFAGLDGQPEQANANANAMDAAMGLGRGRGKGMTNLNLMTPAQRQAYHMQMQQRQWQAQQQRLQMGGASAISMLNSATVNRVVPQQRFNHKPR